MDNIFNYVIRNRMSINQTLFLVVVAFSTILLFWFPATLMEEGFHLDKRVLQYGLPLYFGGVLFFSVTAITAHNSFCWDDIITPIIIYLIGAPLATFVLYLFINLLVYAYG